MELKLTLQRIEPYESFVSETWCPPELVPSTGKMDKEFFESFLMDEFSEEVWDYFNTEFDEILFDMIDHISFTPKARYFLQESYDSFRELALEEARKIAKKYHAVYFFTDEDSKEELFRSDLDLESMMEEWVNNREDDSECSPDVGGAMIRGMEKYVCNASCSSFDIENQAIVHECIHMYRDRKHFLLQMLARNISAEQKGKENAA